LMTLPQDAVICAIYQEQRAFKDDPRQLRHELSQLTSKIPGVFRGGKDQVGVLTVPILR